MRGSRSPSVAGFLAGFVFVLGGISSSPPAFAAGHAEAREVTARVVDEWSRAGGRAVTLPSKFLFDDDRILVPVPPADDGANCVHVAVIGARGLSFRARLSDASRDPLDVPEAAARAASTAGVLELHRCDPSRPVRHVEIASDAGRGALEIVVARSGARLPPLVSLIPERTGGALPPVPEAGPLPPLGPQDKRADGAELRARREGATVKPRQSSPAGEDGMGELELDVEEGCHRVEIFGRELRSDRAGRRYRLDVDAELRDSDQVLARDRTEAPDARVEACVGRASRLTLVFAGTPPGTQALVTRATWPIPARLPPIWGPSTRSKMARAMLTRHIAVPPDDPVYLAQGSSGATPLPIPVETGACYVAIVGVTRGRARQLQIHATVGGRESTDERGAVDEAALSAFCVRAQESARVEIVARGTGVSWGLAVYRVKSANWESGR